MMENKLQSLNMCFSEIYIRTPTSFFPGIMHSQKKRFNVPSEFFRGFATKPCKNVEYITNKCLDIASHLQNKDLDIRLHIYLTQTTNLISLNTVFDHPL